MLSLVAAHVAPALCMLMWWENSGGFCTFSTQVLTNLIYLIKSDVAILRNQDPKYSTEKSHKTLWKDKLDKLITFSQNDIFVYTLFHYFFY